MWQVRASKETLGRYGEIVSSKEAASEFMRNSVWPKVDGWRSLSQGTGNEQVFAVWSFF